jgi:hypothetical protein
MEILIFVTDYLEPSATHFLFSGLVGLIVFCLTQTILYAAYLIFRGNARLTLGLSLFTAGLGLVLAFIAAFYAHALLDGFLDWWTTPLGLPLIILK